MAADQPQTLPQILPITTGQYGVLVEQGKFDVQPGQIELISGRVVRMNPQGPRHSDPIDELQDWSHRAAAGKFRIRIETPVEMEHLHSVPQPNIAWVTRRRCRAHNPTPADIHLLIEVSDQDQ